MWKLNLFYKKLKAYTNTQEERRVAKTKGVKDYVLNIPGRYFETIRVYDEQGINPIRLLCIMDEQYKEWVEENKIQQHIAGKEQDHSRRNAQYQA